MEIKVRVKLESNKSEISKSTESGCLNVKIKSKAKNNMANAELIGLLADEFQVSRKSIKIIKGRKSTTKLLEIGNAD